MTSDTIHTRPTPKRPQWGILAWQFTMGYISTQYSSDAMLSLRAYPVEGGVISWAASASWGQDGAEVVDIPSAAAALSDLWQVIDHHYPKLLRTLEAVSRKPEGYADNEWLDPQTQTVLDRFLQVTWSVFGTDWSLSTFYQPVENPAARVNARLWAANNRVEIEGQGPTLADAYSMLYRNAAKEYAAFRK